MGSSINRDELGPSADNGVPARSLPPTKTLAEALSTKNSIAADGATPTVDAVGPIRIGRYQVLRVLGDGGFGRVVFWPGFSPLVSMSRSTLCQTRSTAFAVGASPARPATPWRTISAAM